jgi:hypothetical protein
MDRLCVSIVSLVVETNYPNIHTFQTASPHNSVWRSHACVNKHRVDDPQGQLDFTTWHVYKYISLMKFSSWLRVSKIVTDQHPSHSELRGKVWLA